jgi:tripartite-type tricarboxylate transporter receptor subunit TctC
MKIINQRDILLFGGLLGLASASISADMEIFPARSIKLLVGCDAGGSSDTVARIMAPRLAEALKQNFVIEKKSGN